MISRKIAAYEILRFEPFRVSDAVSARYGNLGCRL